MVSRYGVRDVCMQGKLHMGHVETLVIGLVTAQQNRRAVGKSGIPEKPRNSLR